MSQPDEFLSRFNEPPDPELDDPHGIEEMREWPEARLRAFVKAYEAGLAKHLPAGPGGVVMVGREAGRAA